MFKTTDIFLNYSYKSVLKGVSAQFDEGKIYALLGENGAGKSTFAHIICGDIKPTSGNIFFNDKEIHFETPKDAIQYGIVCVHQRPLLSSSISIKENLKLGQKKFDVPMAAKADELLHQWLPGRTMATVVKELQLEETFFVSLIGALLRNPKLLILDEPPFIPIEKLHSLTEQGITIIMITHSLKEALEKSDRIILLQDGKILEHKETSLFTEKEIQQKLFGISKEVKCPDFIQIQNLSENDVMNLRKNDKNIGYIPSDKTFRASNPNLTILQLLTAYNPKGHKSELETYAASILKKAEVNICLNEKTFCLSGGMLQRIILEREIARSPKTLYLFNPTKGLDVEGKQRLYSKLKTLSDNGTKIIIGTEEEA